MRQYCNFHHGGQKGFKESYDPKDYCCLCQSVKDSKHSNDIYRNHVAGKKCKDSNHCPDCCYIRHLGRVLRHIGKACSKNNKCPVCYSIKKHNYDYTKSNQQKQMYLEWLYTGMLCNKRQYFPHLGWGKR